MSDIGLILSAVTDPDFKEKTQELREAHVALVVQQKALQADIEKNNALLREAQNERAKAQAMIDDVAAREKQLKEKAANLDQMLDATKKENAKWDEMRELVDRQHKAKETALARQAAQQDAVMIAQMEKAAELRDREVDIKAKEARHAALATAAKQFVDTHG
jgi:predicted nuclease with TOPRIM domain